MSIPRPKILSVVTVPTDGWTLRIKYSTVAAGQFGETVDATIPAGDYFVAWDCQSDDFMWKLANVCNVALHNAALADWVGRSQGMAMWIDSDHKVHIGFAGSWFADFANAHRDVRIAWTEEDGASIGAVLGFDTSADLDLTGVESPLKTRY